MLLEPHLVGFSSVFHTVESVKVFQLSSHRSRVETILSAIQRDGGGHTKEQTICMVCACPCVHVHVFANNTPLPHGKLQNTTIHPY